MNALLDKLLPKIDSAVRAQHEQRVGVVVTSIFWLLIAVGGLWPAAARATGLTPLRSTFVIFAHLGYYLFMTAPPFRRLALDDVRLRLVWLGAFVVCASLSCALVYFSRNPASPWWLLYFYFVTLGGATFSASWLLLFGYALPPLLVAAALSRLGIAPGFAPFLIAGAGVLLLRFLSALNDRRRAALAARDNLLAQLELARGERDRARVVRAVTEQLHRLLAPALIEAEALRQGELSADAIARMLASLRLALAELRTAVWTLDPRHAAREVFEAQLARTAADLVSPDGCHLESRLPPEAELATSVRLRLLGALRQNLAAGAGAARLVIEPRGAVVALLVERAGARSDLALVGEAE